MGRYILILDDQYYVKVMENLSKLFDSLQKKNQLLTMKLSLKKYTMYPEISGGNPISNTLRIKAAQIRSKLSAQPKTTVPKSLPPTPRQAYFWGNILGTLDSL